MIQSIPLPDFFEEDLKWVGQQFPDAVKYDPVDFTTEFLSEIPPKVGVALEYGRFVTTADEVVKRMNISISEIRYLPRRKFSDLDSYRQRYHLFSSMFFVELARVRDAWGRHLKRLQDFDMLEKSERVSVRKLFNEQFEEHYLLRNVYLHGYMRPKTKNEHLLDLIIANQVAGNEPRLYPLDGGDPLEFAATLKEVCSSRAKGLLSIGRGAREFINHAVETTASWAYNKVRMLEM